MYSDTFDKTTPYCNDPIEMILLHELIHTLGYWEEVVPCACGIACFKDAFFKNKSSVNYCQRRAKAAGRFLCACDCKWLEKKR